jgi:hypothetical protein
MRRNASNVVLFAILGALVGAGWAWAPRPSLAADEANKAWPPVVLPGTLEVAVNKSDRLTVVKLVAPLPTEDPYAVQWWQAPYVEVEVTPQQMAMPTLAEASIDKIRVQALTDGEWISWRVSWHDPSPDGNVDVRRFSDGVALEFPLDPDALPMMGHEGARVQILHWKALWQKDLDVGFQDVQDLHPNFWTDLYWFAEGEFPFPIPEAFANPVSRQWFVAQQAGNPMAAFSRRQPVEELLAEGWSTLTHQTYSVTTGRGVWVRDSWAVVFSRPLKTEDPLDYQFSLGSKGQVAFAVWQGAAGDVGGRKHWSDWVEFEVQP